MRTRSLLLAAVVASGLSGCKATQSFDRYPMFDGPQQRVDLWDIDWRVKLVTPPFFDYQPRELATPAFDPDTERVYTLTRDKKIRAISPAGEVEWEFETDGAFNAGASVADNVVYAPGADGFLYALRGRSGELVWKYEAKEELGTSPVVDGALVLVASMTDTLFAVNRETGVWVWQYRRDTPAGFTIRGASNPVVSGGRVFMGFSDGYLVALDASDGTLVWERQLGNGKEFLDVDTTPVVDETSGRLFVASYSDGLYALDTATGDVAWNSAVGGISNLITHGNRVITSGDGRISAYDASTGTLGWTHPTGELSGRRPLMARGHLIVPMDGALLFLDPETGRPTVSWDPGEGVSAAPALAGSQLFVLSNLGYLYSIHLSPKGQG